jgi:hypothetical protein
MTYDTYIRQVITIELANIIYYMSAYGIAVIVSRNVLGRSCRLRKRDIAFAFAGYTIYELINYLVMTIISLSHFQDLDPDTTTEELLKSADQFRLTDDELFLYSYLVLAALILIYFVIFLLKHKERKISSALISTLVFISTVSTVEKLVSNIILLSSNDWQQSWENNVYSVGVDLTSSIGFFTAVLTNVAIFLILYFRLFRKEKILGIRPLYIVVFCIALSAVVNMGALPFSSDYTEDQISYYARILLGIFIPLIMLAVTLILVLNNLRENQKAANENQARYLEAELSYIAQYKKNENETRKFRHDIINNLSLMDMMVKEGHIDEAREHLRQMLENINSLSRRFSTGDEMLDLIVTMKADVMEDEKISFNCTGSFENGLDMKAFDTCGIFAEALDSAIKACKAEKGVKDPEINMTLTETDTSRMISIKNNCIGNGTFNLDNSCIRSYGGTVRALKKDDVTELILTLPKTRKKEAATA